MLVVRAKILLITFLFFLSSCADDVDKVKDKDSKEDDKSLGVLQSEADLPDCTAGISGKTYYVKDEARFRFCENGEWVDFDGLNGSLGSGSGVGLSVVDAEGVVLGDLISLQAVGFRKQIETVANSFTIRFSNGGIGTFRANDGKFSQFDDYYDGLGFRHRANICYFSSSDCSGTCSTKMMPLNKIMYAGSEGNFFYSEGAKSEGTKTINSAYDLSSCVATSATFTVSYPLAKPVEFPDGVSYPFTAPFSVE